MENSLIFGLIIPGQIPVTQFQIINGNFIYDLLNPGCVSSITFYQFQQLPENQAGSLYYSTPPFQDLEFIGAIANQRPSDIFNTNFALHPDINSLPFLKLVIRIEPLENLRSLVEIVGNQNIQKQYGEKVAQNLYNFMVSLNQAQLIQNVDSSEWLVVPSNFLERWIKRFHEKFNRDPNFIMKTSMN